MIGFAHWDPAQLGSWVGPAKLFGSMIGIYATVALSEELYFRGILENLLSGTLRGPVLARLIASLLFGLAHLSPGFPNWRYASIAAVAGWFYGRAYSENHSVVASAVTHTLVVVTQKFLFPQV
jgi:membrane protease YdiL (CAAX protease family)